MGIQTSPESAYMLVTSTQPGVGTLRSVNVRVVASLMGMALLAIPNAAASGAPGAPTHLQITSVDSSTVLVSWSPPTTGGPVSYYVLERLSTTGAPTRVATTDTQTTEVRDENLTVADDAVVGYSVTAYGAGGVPGGTDTQYFLINVDRLVPGGGQECWPVSIGPDISVDGGCAIRSVTEPLPEPYRTQARTTALPLYYMVLDEIKWILSLVES